MLRAPRRRWLLGAAIALSAAVSAIIALPLLPERDLQGSVVMALNPAQGETVGWPRFVQTVADAWQRIPLAERRHTAIFTSNYGEAGAIELLRARARTAARLQRPQRLQRMGDPAGRRHATRCSSASTGTAEAAPYFTQCRTLARVNDGVGLDNEEQGLPVMLCRTAGRWTALWSHLRHYD